MLWSYRHHGQFYQVNIFIHLMSIDMINTLLQRKVLQMYRRVGEGG